MSTTVLQIPVTDIHPHPRNPRRDLGDLVELADSIRAHGVRQALVVVPHCTGCPDADQSAIRLKEDDGTTWCPIHKREAQLRTVIGHRRVAAARMAGLTDVPAIIDPTLSEADQLELLLVENVQRSDLTPVEEADGYQGLLDLGISVTMIAKRTGRSRSTVERRLKLLALPEDARAKVHTREATLEDAAQINEFADHPEIVEKLTAALGTSNFDWGVERARKDLAEEAAREKTRQKLLKMGLKELTARQADKRTDWNEVHDQYGVTSIPKDLKGATAFHFSYYLRFFRETTDAERLKFDKSDKTKARRQALKEAEDKAIAEAIAECETATILREGFIRALLLHHLVAADVREKIAATAAHLILSGELEMRSWQIQPGLAAIVCDEDLKVADYLAAYQGTPEALLLAAIHIQHTPSTYSRKDWRHAHKNRGIVALYELLESIGYLVSDAERARIWPDTTTEG